MKDIPVAKLFISSLKIKGEKIIPTTIYTLNPNDVLIYSIYLPNFIKLKTDLVQYLDQTEQHRANRFYKEIDGTRFIIYRSILKIVLSAYTILEAKNITFDYDSNNKPYLSAFPWLHFNISHSEDYAIIAISRNKVGIDIEFMSEEFNFKDILPDVFAPNEVLEIQNAEDEKDAFYTSWTRKEAFVKALGKGIDEDFKHIPSIDGHHTINFSVLKTTTNWQLHSFDFANHYKGAIAFEGFTPLTENIVLYSISNTMKKLLHW
jgi:4'-phosphopantetheinyl transferase